jgi:NAD(P)-dependent dehydrogenase (short-subunit alcohol dehydrogenase family)
MAEPSSPRRALVTGAAKGIGSAIARRLASQGREVVVADRDAAGAEEVARAIGGRAAALDVTDFAQLRAVVAETGPFAIVVNNAGVDQHAFFTAMPEAEWRRLLEVNLVAVLAVVHATLPAMQAARFGRIVNIVSEAARLGSKGGSVYAAAKGGVISFTKSIARENARYGITAKCVAPGPIDTPMLQEGLAKVGEKLKDAVVDATLMKRLGTPDEVAAAVAFLASDEASYITGETLGVSGGMGLGA